MISRDAVALGRRWWFRFWPPEARTNGPVIAFSAAATHAGPEGFFDRAASLRVNVWGSVLDIGVGSRVDLP